MKKLEQFLFYLFLVAIPFSLRHIFGYQAVGFMEWKAISVYGTDILLVALLVLWATETTGPRKRVVLSKADWVLGSFIIVTALSIKNAINVEVAWFQWFKIIEGALLYLYIKNYAFTRFNLTGCFIAFVIGGLIQAIIAIGQFVAQHSLGLGLLGENVLAPGMTGVAAFISDGVKIIRAYGTMPHPNILAAYLFIALGAFYYIAIFHKQRWWWYGFHALTLWAFLLTFSRTIIGLWVLNFAVRTVLIRFYPRFRKEFWNNKEMRRRCLNIFVVTIITAAAFAAAYWPYVHNRAMLSTQDEAIKLRMLYNRQSISGDIHWLGVGPGNFVPWLKQQQLPVTGIGLPPEQYQPVHNIYLLIYSETGLIGLALFVAFLVLLLIEFYHRTKFHKLYHFSFMLISVSLLIAGFFDHFLWTIQSGQLIFWLVVGLLATAI